MLLLLCVALGNSTSSTERRQFMLRQGSSFKLVLFILDQICLQRDQTSSHQKEMCAIVAISWQIALDLLFSSKGIKEIRVTMSHNARFNSVGSYFFSGFEQAQLLPVLIPISCATTKAKQKISLTHPPPLYTPSTPLANPPPNVCTTLGDPPPIHHLELKIFKVQQFQLQKKIGMTWFWVVMLKLVSCSVTSKTYLKGAMISPHGLCHLDIPWEYVVCTYYLATHPPFQRVYVICTQPPTYIAVLCNQAGQSVVCANLAPQRHSKKQHCVGADLCKKRKY